MKKNTGGIKSKIKRMEAAAVNHAAGKEWISMAVLAVAVALIAIGAYNVWKSFQRFDSSVLSEKDAQFYSLMRSDDINIENTINAVVREAETYFSRQLLRNKAEEWRETGDVSDLAAYIKENNLQNNPVYADLIVMYKGDVYRTASGSTEYSFITNKDPSGIRLVSDEDGIYYMSYEHDYSKNISFDVLIDLRRFYGTAVGMSPEREVMLIDNTSTLMLTAGTDGIEVSPAREIGSDDKQSCREYLVRCQRENISDGMSVEMNGADGTTYTARVLTLPSRSTVNGEFGIGIIADYEEAMAPSRRAAGEFLIYGSIMVIGIIGLILMVFLMRRASAVSSQELMALKKKNEQMEEINQKMQALSHHQRLETIGTMTASIAHDFNNLLTPIMGYSIMTMEMLPADATDLQENLLEVYNASVKAKDIVTRLAELTKKGNEANYKEVEVDEVIQSALKVTLPAKPKNVEVKANFAAKDTMIRADRTQISQLVMNIVLNAYDAMRDEGGTVMVSTRRSGEEVIMRFKDTGCGMDAETVSRIFDPFYTTKESGKGTGLGLAIVAQIVETHGGRIYVESEPGEGTEFRIYLPCADAVMAGLSWGLGDESKFDTKRYNTSMFLKALADAVKEEIKD